MFLKIPPSHDGYVENWAYQNDKFSGAGMRPRPPRPQNCLQIGCKSFRKLAMNYLSFSIIFEMFAVRCLLVCIQDGGDSQPRSFLFKRARLVVSFGGFLFFCVCIFLQFFVQESKISSLLVDFSVSFQLELVNFTSLLY